VDAEFDAIAQAMSGLMSMTGADEPTMVGTYIADYVAGMYGAIGTLNALRHRDRTGEGQVVDIASVDSIFSCLATQAAASVTAGVVPRRVGARDALTAPGNVFRASDGYIYIHGGTNALFPRLCAAMGRPELAQDPRFVDVGARVAHVEEIEATVQAWVEERTTEEAGPPLTRYGIPWGPVLSVPDVIASDYARERELMLDLEHPVLGRVPVPASPLRLSATPPRLRRSTPDAGQDTDEVLLNVGFSQRDVAAFRNDAVV